MNNLIDWLDKEIELHDGKENAAETSWDRGYENGAKTEAIVLKSRIKQFAKENPNVDLCDLIC